MLPEWLNVVEVLAGAVGGIGLSGIVVAVLQRRKTLAEAKLAEAGAGKLGAETDSIEVSMVAQLWAQLSAHQQQITEVRVEVSRLTIENAMLRAENAQFKATNARLEAEKVHLESRLAEMDGRLLKLQERLAGYEAMQARMEQAGKALEGGA